MVGDEAEIFATIKNARRGGTWRWPRRLTPEAAAEAGVGDEEEEETRR